MSHALSIAAVRLVMPGFGRRRVGVVRSRNGLVNLKRRAWQRAMSLWLRPWNFAALAISVLVMFVGENAAAVPYVVMFGLLVFAFQRGLAAPKRRRGSRIVSDVRPLLMHSVIQLPESKRAGRIVRAQPGIVIPDLPPDRPRTRISERRPGPMEDVDE